MEWKDFTQTVKDANLPYYLSDDSENITNYYCEDIDPRLTNSILSKKIILSAKTNEYIEKSPPQGNLNGTDSLKILGISSPKLSETTPRSSSLENIMQTFLQENRSRDFKANLRIKCTSLERVSLNDLGAFYRFNYTTKRIKKMVHYYLYIHINLLV